MQFILKAYKELSVDELYEVLKLRCAIFVIEQNCNYQDMDDKDQESYHLLGYDHIIDADYRVMHKKEQELLKKIV